MNSGRHLSLTTATALVIASMVGAGVFTTSGFLMADLGSPWIVLLAWLVGGIQAALGALCYGALARRIPESGGEYLFLSRTLDPAFGNLAGWISLLAGFSAPLAAAAFAFGEYTAPWLNNASPVIIGSVMILALAALHATHVQRGAGFQNLIVALKVILIVGLAAYALPQLPEHSPSPSSPFSLPVFGVSLVWISFSYSGWNAAVYIGGEIRNPERNLPRSLLLGTGMVTVMYLALNAVFVFAAPAEEIAGQLQVGRIAAEAVGGKGLGDFVAAVIALALLTSISSLSMAGPRVYARMAEDGCLPKALAARDGPPRLAIASQALVALGLLWAMAYEDLLTYIGFTLMLGTAATVVGLIRLRLREGRSFAVPGWPWVPGLFLLGVLGMTLFSIMQRPLISLTVLIALGAGYGAWHLTHQRAKTENRS